MFPIGGSGGNQFSTSKPLVPPKKKKLESLSSMAEKDNVLRLRKFNMDKMKNSVRIAIIGRSGSGKTVLIEDIMKHKRTIPSGICISGTVEGRKTYSKFIPDTFIYDKYDSDTVKKFLNVQMEKIANRDPHPDAFIIMDDCFYEKKTWAKNEEINYIFMNSRNDKIFFVLSMQYMMGIPPELRANIDYVFVLKNNIKSNREQLYKHYAGMFNSLQDFETVMDNFTEDYGCLVIDNKSTSNNVEDQIFWYKADLHGDFTVGAKWYWNFHNQHYVPEGAKPKIANKFEIGENAKPKRKPKIKTKKVYDVHDFESIGGGGGSRSVVSKGPYNPFE